MSFDMDLDELADAVNAGDTAHVTAAYKYALDERDHCRSERDEARRERDGWKDIADRRYALRSELEAALGIPHGPAESDSVEKAHARLRAILDERDAALAREARLREAAAGIETVGGRGLTPESAAILNAALEVGPWPATATTWLADRERAAEERGADWALDAWRPLDPSRPGPRSGAEVCRAARKEGTR